MRTRTATDVPAGVIVAITAIAQISSVRVRAIRDRDRDPVHELRHLENRCRGGRGPTYAPPLSQKRFLRSPWLQVCHEVYPAHRQRMTFTDRIEINARVMLGKPVIQGTRIPVELIFRKLSE